MLVVEEVRERAESDWGAGRSASPRAVFGFPNGACLSTHLGVRQPDVYGTAIGFSVAGGESRMVKAQAAAARFYLFAGIYEYPCCETTAKLAAAMHAAGVDIVHREGCAVYHSASVR